jgi:PIN domain nuclease of toxin-antitoxin system
MRDGVLLDTCACLWLTHGDPLRENAREAVQRAQATGGVFVSAITAWEVATLVRKGRYRLKVSVQTWLTRLLALPGMRLAGLDPAILIASAELPGSPPADPADRMICATARARSLAVMTRDQRILAYGTAGHVNVVPC